MWTLNDIINVWQVVIGDSRCENAKHAYHINLYATRFVKYISHTRYTLCCTVKIQEFIFHFIVIKNKMGGWTNFEG